MCLGSVGTNVHNNSACSKSYYNLFFRIHWRKIHVFGVCMCTQLKSYAMFRCSRLLLNSQSCTAARREHAGQRCSPAAFGGAAALPGHRPVLLPARGSGGSRAAGSTSASEPGPGRAGAPGRGLDTAQPEPGAGRTPGSGLSSGTAVCARAQKPLCLKGLAEV